MTQTVSKLIIEIGGNEYEFSGGGTPDDNSVGTDQIIDGSVEEEDLSDDVKGKINDTYDESDESLDLGGLNME